MSTNRNPLDDLFRQGAGQREFPFQESYWLQAEQMILAEQKRRKQYLLSLISYTLIVVTVISIPLLIWIFSGNRLFAELRPVEQPMAFHSLLESPSAISEGVPLASSYVLPSGERYISSQLAYERSRSESRSALSVREQRTDQVAMTYTPLLTQSDRNEPIALSLEDTPATQKSSLSLRSLKKLQFGNSIFALANLMGREVDVLRSKYPRNELSLWLGFNLSPNTLQPSNWGSHPVAGLRYTRAITPRLKIYTGLMYQGRGAINAVTNVRQIEYGFGADVDASMLTVNRLHYIEMPLGIDLRLYKGHYLLMGGQVSYLANASGTLNNRVENSFGVIDEQESLAWGYTEGLRRWNPALTAGYAFYWKRGLRLGATANYYLKAPFRDDYYLERDLTRFQVRVFAEFYLSHF